MTMAIPDVEIFQQLAHSQYSCNISARWHQCLWFKRWGLGSL